MAPQPLSLRYLLLRQLLPALLLLLLAGAATAYWVAWRSATKAYDRALYDTALAISEQLRVVNGKPQLPLTPQARTVLLTDKFDRIYYGVRGAGQELLDGEPGLPMPPAIMLRRHDNEGRYYYDGILADQPVRVAALQTVLAGTTITVIAGETLVKRNALIREIILGMILPEILLTLVSVSVVWFGIRAGLKPLTELRQELAGRSQTDLSQVRVDVPEEIQPVVTEINELLLRLAHSLASQRNFVSDAAHQLRTPIAALQAQAEAACRESPADSRQQLEGVLSAAHRLSHLVDQMLALARAEPSLSQTQPEIGLEEFARQLAETWLPQAIRKGIDLGFELAPATVRGNELLLQELFGNLLDNALRHAPEGGTVTVSCGREGSEAWLAIEDNGPGIADDERDKIFARFYQAPGSRSNGNGLGLAIVHEIVRQHGGRISVGSSASLGGALFKVWLPAMPVARALI